MNKQLIKRSPYGVVSLTLGIISVIFALYWVASVPTSIIAIVFGNKGRKIYESKTATAGMITGICGLSMTGLWILFGVGVAIFKAANYYL